MSFQSFPKSSTIAPPTSVTVVGSVYSGTTQTIIWQINTPYPLTGVETSSYGYRTSIDGINWGTEIITMGPLFNSPGFTSGNQYAQVRAYYTTPTGLGIPTNWTTSSPVAYVSVVSSVVTTKGISISGTLSTGVIGSVQIPFNATINNWTIISQDNVSGSIQFDVQTSSYASFTPGSAGTSVVSSAPPVMTSAVKAQSSTLTGWSTSLNKGDYMIFSITSFTSLDNVRIEISLTSR